MSVPTTWDATSAPATTVALSPALFGERPAELARHGALRLHASRSPDGVAVLRLASPAGHVDVLPFRGQQVWDAVFLGRTLTMRSLFDQPVAAADYLSGNGALLVHCGGTAMGNPSAEDTHPLHGELPQARLEAVRLGLGEDQAGRYVQVSGRTDYRKAFTGHYRATLELRLYEAATVCHAGVTIENRGQAPLDYMYLAHLNFRPADGGWLAETREPGGVVTRTTLPGGLAVTPELRRATAAIEADPSARALLRPGVAVVPELVQSVRCRAGADGWSHALQLHPSGESDVVSHRPAELPHALRWLRRSPDDDAFGFLLPATAEADGYLAEKRKGHVRSLAPGERFGCRYAFGALDVAGTARLADVIGRVNRRP